MKEPSLETKLHQAKEEGKKLEKEAKGRGNPAFTPPDSLPLMQEKEPNKFEVMAFQLEEFLKKPLVYINEDGKEVFAAESMEKAFEGESALKMLGEGLWGDAQRALRGDTDYIFYFHITLTALSALPHKSQQTALHAFEVRSNGKTFEEVLQDNLPALGKVMAQYVSEGDGDGARKFLTSLSTLPSESQQTVLDAFKEHTDGKTFEEVLPEVLPVLGEIMSGYAQFAMKGKYVSTWYFLTALTSISTLSQQQQQTTLDAFKEHSGGKTFEEVLPSILLVLRKDMARAVEHMLEGHRINTWVFLTSLSSLKTLATHYHALAEQQRAQDELHTNKKETTEPVIPPKNF